MTVHDATVNQKETVVGWIKELPRPEPSGGTRYYEAEKRKRLMSNVDTFTNYTRYLNDNRSAKPDYLPIKLDIEGVSRCNFACTMCAVSKWWENGNKGRRARDMTLDEFKALIDEQYGLLEIKLNGLGEPLMAGDVLFDMIRYARSKHIWVRITTNASLLHLRDNYRKLIDADTNEIDISIDGADTKTFEGIRIQSDFNQVRSNCKLLNDYCKEKGIVRTKMWTLVQKGNAHNLPQHVRLADALGFRHLVFSLQLHGWGDTLLGERNAEKEVGGVDVDYLTSLGASLGVRVSFWNTNEKFSTQSTKSLCPWPFERAVVTSDSRTVACCMIGDPDQHELAKGDDFSKAWKSLDYQEFRQAHLDGNIPQVCKGCYK